MNNKLQKALISKDVSMLERFTSKGEYNLGDDKFLSSQLHKHKWSLLNIVEIGNPNLTKLFLESDNSIHVNDIASHGRSALHQAVYDLDVCHVKLLLDHNADTNSLDRSSKTPLYYLYNNHKPSTNHDDALEIINAFIQRGAKAFSTRHNVNELQVSEALEKGNAKVVESVLNMTSIDLNEKYDTDGYTVLHHLARNSNPKLLQTVMGDREFEVDARNSFQQTPLWCAARASVPDAVEFLLSKGADVNAATDKKYDNPVSNAIMRYYGRDSKRKKLYMDCILLLLEHGADIQVVDEDDYTVFDLALENRNESLCELMLEYLALREASGTEITKVMQSKIDSKQRFKKHLDTCKQLVATEVYPSKTVVKLLTCSEEKFVPYMRNEELVGKLNSYRDHLKSIRSVYYHQLLQKRLMKASETAKLRDSAAVVIGKLTKIDYPFILDIIISYLDTRDLETLLNLEL